ncbi:hypothetical protein [uncultured Campylobacter sp.]|nr:hypothetical protein [uncultured Campylobacter sp.]
MRCVNHKFTRANLTTPGLLIREVIYGGDFGVNFVLTRCEV